MNVKNYLNSMTQNDIFSFMLFVLYRNQKIPELSSISELAYILDRDNLFKLCEYFGGETIKIPTIDELKILTQSLLLYEQVNIEHKDLSECLLNLKETKELTQKINANYILICDILKEIELNV